MGIRIRTRSRSSDSGFTLLEVMLALTIMAIGVLSLAALQLMTMDYGNRGKHATQAGLIAQDRIERLQRLTWANLTPTAGWSAPEQINARVDDGGGLVVTQTYRRYTRISDAVPGVTRRVDVRVEWDEPKRPGRTFALSTLRYNTEGL